METYSKNAHRFTRCTNPGIIYPSFSPYSTPLFSTISSRKPEQFSKSVLIASEFWNLGFHFWLFEVQSLVVSASLIFCCILQQIVCTTVFRSFSTFLCAIFNSRVVWVCTFEPWLSFYFIWKVFYWLGV